MPPSPGTQGYCEELRSNSRLLLLLRPEVPSEIKLHRSDRRTIFPYRGKHLWMKLNTKVTNNNRQNTFEDYDKIVMSVLQNSPVLNVWQKLARMEYRGFHSFNGKHRKFHAVIVIVTVFVLCCRGCWSSRYSLLFCCIWHFLHLLWFLISISHFVFLRKYTFYTILRKYICIFCRLLLYFRKYIIKTVKEIKHTEVKRYGKNHLHGR